MLASVAGAAAALALATGSGAREPTPPCRGNEDATTITQKTYSGSNGPDTIQANDKDNVIYGLDGRDTICAYMGKDEVHGGNGKDDLWGEDLNDKLIGGPNADVLRGGAGDNDKCVGGDPPKPQGDPDPDAAIDCERVDGASG